MVWGLVAAGGAALGSAILGSRSADKAADAQKDASSASIAETRRQFDALEALLAPYAEGGEEALSAQQALIGLQGGDAQQAAIDQLQQSPQFTSMIDQGENAILQNASATGGLRGGNVQQALSQFRPQVLSNLIQQQYSNLGGLTSIGQNAAAMTGNAGMQAANSIGNQYQLGGDASANAALAKGKIYGNLLGNIGGMAAGAF